MRRMSHHPTDGVRVLLELNEARGADGASYRGAVFTPLTQTDFSVRFDAAGGVTAVATEAVQAEGPGDRGREILLAIARTVARHARAESPIRWPRRVLRWRRG